MQTNRDISPYIPLSRGVFIYGPVGSGKTVLACSIIREIIIQRGTDGILFISSPKFILHLQLAWRREAVVDEILDNVCQKEILLFDDIGAEKMTDFVRQSLYYLINEREQWERKTIITSNYSLSQLDEYIDGRISSRIAGMCDIVELKGKDRRVE